MRRRTVAAAGPIAEGCGSDRCGRGGQWDRRARRQRAGALDGAAPAPSGRGVRPRSIVATISHATPTPRMTSPRLKTFVNGSQGGRTNRSMSHEKARRELGYAPRSLEETLRDTYAWAYESGMMRRVS